MVQYAPNATGKNNNDDTSESFHQELRKQLRLNEFQINGLVLCKLSICARKISLYTIANGLFLHANMYEIHLEKNEKKARAAHTISHIYHTILGYTQSTFYSKRISTFCWPWSIDWSSVFGVDFTFNSIPCCCCRRLTYSRSFSCSAFICFKLYFPFVVCLKLSC